MVRFLHISEALIRSFRDEAGPGVKRIAKPGGFWMARDLAWVGLMDKARSWYPRPDFTRPGPEPPGRILAAYAHVFATRPVPAPADGETVQPLPWRPHYVYEAEIPEESFTSDVSAPDPSRILRLSRGNLDAFLAAYTAFRREWDMAPSLGGPDAILKGDVLTGAVTTSRENPIRNVLDKTDAKKVSNSDVLKDRGDRIRILSAITAGTLTLPEPLQKELTVAIWKAFVERLRTQWGGLEFMEDLFTPEGDDPELVARVELLRRLDVPSLVLFSLSRFPTPTLRAVLSGGPVTAPEGVPVYRFGVTDTGELRSLPSTGGRRRRRTRRRMFKNPKTLKKRIR